MLVSDSLTNLMSWRKAFVVQMTLCGYYRSVTKLYDPVYYLYDCPARGFVREELLVVSEDTELPPDTILKHQRAR